VKIKNILFVCCSLIFSAISAQNSIKKNYFISGKVINKETKLPLEFATISLKSAKIKKRLGVITNTKGKFKINVPSGIYDITISYFSFKSIVLKNKTINSNLNLGNLKLIYSTNNLNTIEVVAQKKLVDFKLGKRIYHVSQDIANKGGNAVDVLENAPYIRVNSDNSVSIRNNSNVQILIDGKLVDYLDGDIDALKSIPASSIKDVEIITNRTAKYDAKGSGGIINIILKKAKSLGLYGSIESHLTHPADNGISANVNYKTKSINIFSTNGYNYSNNPLTTHITQKYVDTNLNTLGFLKENGIIKRQRTTWISNIGADFYLNKYNTITASFLYKTRQKNYDSNYSFDNFNSIQTPLNSTMRFENYNDQVDRTESYLKYNKKFKKAGENFSVEFKFDDAKAYANSFIIEKPINLSVNQTLQSVKKAQTLKNYLIQTDYVLPFGKNGQLETGLKSTRRNYGNIYNVSQLDTTSNAYVTIGGYDDIIDYKENIYAAYAQLSNKFKGVTYIIGLRSETSNIKISQRIAGNSNNKNYTNLFPNANISYEFKDGAALNASYSRSIARPTIYQINPFMTFTDERFQTVGNINVNPYYTYFYETDYYKRFNKLSFTSSIYYSRSKNFLTYIIRKTGAKTSDGFDIYKRFPVNNGLYNSLGSDIDFNYSPVKMLRLSAYATVYSVDISKAIAPEYNTSDIRWYTQISSLLKFKSGLKVQIKYDYQSRFKDGPLVLKPIQFVNFAMAKNIFKNSSTLTFRIHDLVNSNKQNSNTFEANTFTNRIVQPNQREYVISFSYRFNQKRKTNKHDRRKELNKKDF